MYFFLIMFLYLNKFFNARPLLVTEYFYGVVLVICYFSEDSVVSSIVLLQGTESLLVYLLNSGLKLTSVLIICRLFSQLINLFTKKVRPEWTMPVTGDTFKCFIWSSVQNPKAFNILYNKEKQQIFSFNQKQQIPPICVLKIIMIIPLSK